jgi:hypothetical protein
LHTQSRVDACLHSFYTSYTVYIVNAVCALT